MKNPEDPIHPDAVKHQVHFRLDALRRQPYEVLAQLPPWSEELVAFGESSVEVVTYRKGSVGEDLRIIVQCVPQGAIRGMVWRGVYAHGFHMTPNGDVREMADWERFVFM